MHKLRVAITLVVLSAVSLSAQDAAKSSKKEAKSAESVFPIERSLFDALARNDIPSFNKGLGGDFVYVSGDGALLWQLSKSAEMLKDCKTGKATFTNVEERRVGADLVVLTYTANAEQTCGGKKSPNPVNAMSVWRKTGGKWVAIAHSETPVSTPAK